MKISEVARDEHEEDLRRKTNPLNGGEVNDTAWDIMDEFDEHFFNVVNELKRLTPNLPASEYYKRAINLVSDSVNPVSVPIDKLTSTEPGYNDDHVKKIDISSNNHPNVYHSNGMYVIADGNHRVLAAYFAGKKDVKVNLITINDINKVAKEYAKKE